MACSRMNALLAMLRLLVLCLSGLEAETEVTVSQGHLRGTTLTSRNGRAFPAFLGIPYAQPPIGPLRFKTPLTAEKWNGTLMATADGNQCPQYDENNAVIGYEDCLYLNVYTPQLNPSVLYPTMVYIHGGRFVMGNSSSTTVGPEYLMDKDVVLVAMNYRLGVLGFLSTGDAEAPGNFGLKDQVLALRWVQENIKTFGGDPKRVTLFGQSAGGVSVNLHVLSDLSDGLFDRYISQSGSPLAVWGFTDNSEYKVHSTDLGVLLNCPTNNSQVLIECLRGIDVDKIVDSDSIFTGALKLAHTWVPTDEPELDGAFLTSSPIDRMLKHKMKDLPFICGNVADEGLLYTSLYKVNDTLNDLAAYNLDSFLTDVTMTFLQPDNAEKLAANVKDFYFPNFDPGNRAAFFKNMTNLVTDAGFIYPIMVQMQLALRNTNNDFYYYLFDYRGTISETTELIGTNEDIGVTHTDELIYIFPFTPKQLGYPELNISESDEHIIDLMIDFWTSFATNGIPTSNHSIDPIIWKPYTSNEAYLQIGFDTDPRIMRRYNFHEKRMHFWAMQTLKIALNIN